MSHTYTLSYPNGTPSVEIEADSDDAAIAQAKAILGGNAVECDQWDADGWDADDQPRKRLLFWASEQDAENDAGANAIAELRISGQTGELI